jgi:hypothetical protein
LIEVVMTAGILVCGLVAVASVFSFAIRANATNRQMAVGTTLLYDKFEAFRSASVEDPIWLSPNGAEYFVIAGERYSREWVIGSAFGKTVTVIVYAESTPLTHRRSELIRATTIVSPTF